MGTERELFELVAGTIEAAPGLAIDEGDPEATLVRWKKDVALTAVTRPPDQALGKYYSLNRPRVKHLGEQSFYDGGDDQVEIEIQIGLKLHQGDMFAHLRDVQWTREERVRALVEELSRTTEYLVTCRKKEQLLSTDNMKAVTTLMFEAVHMRSRL